MKKLLNASHLDFSSKIHAGSIISSALDMEIKPSKEQQKISDIDLLKSVRKNMFDMGFENINDYFEHLDSLQNNEEEVVLS